MSRINRNTIAFCIVFLCALFTVGGVVAQNISRRKDIPAIAKAANGAIVSVVMSDKDGQPVASGTGFLVSKDGRVVTNYHVIAEGSSAVVKLPDGAFYDVDGVLVFDKHRDVAVIKAHGENFRTLTLGNSDRLQVGEEIVAIGNPLSLESTVSNGIVSGIRTSEAKGGKFLQVTAPISPGSSGGPLFNMAGEVVGITTMYLEGGENLNFAIPINDAKRLLNGITSKLEPFPNDAPEKDEPPATRTAVNININSPAFKYFNSMLEAHEVNTRESAYACFNDNPNENEADWFRLIRVMQLGDWWSADILVVEKVAVKSIFGYDYQGTPKLGAHGEIETTFSSDVFLPVGGVSDLDKAIHKDDYLKWSSDKISFQYGTDHPSPSVHAGYYSISFTMGRPSGKYVMALTPEGSIFDGRLNTYVRNSLPAHSETGQCIRIPGSKTLEEQLQGSSQ